MLSGEVLQGSVLLGARLPIRQWDRTEVRARAVGVLTPAQGTPHAGFNAIHLLEPGFVECLGCRHLLCGGGCGRFSFGLRAVVATLTPRGPAFTLLSSGRSRGRSRRAVRLTCVTRLSNVLGTGTGLQC